MVEHREHDCHCSECWQAPRWLTWFLVVAWLIAAAAYFLPALLWPAPLPR
jgi:hypothetical protein